MQTPKFLFIILLLLIVPFVTKAQEEITDSISIEVDEIGPSKIRNYDGNVEEVIRYNIVVKYEYDVIIKTEGEVDKVELYVYSTNGERLANPSKLLESGKHKVTLSFNTPIGQELDEIKVELYLWANEKRSSEPYSKKTIKIKKK